MKIDNNTVINPMNEQLYRKMVSSLKKTEYKK